MDDFRSSYFDFGWDNLGKDIKLYECTLKLNNGHTTMLDIPDLVIHEKIGFLVCKIRRIIGRVGSSCGG